MKKNLFWANLDSRLITNEGMNNMKILTESKTETFVSYSRDFRYASDPGAGFGFPCDKNGSVQSLNPAAQENFEACLKGEVRGEKVIDLGISQHQNTYRSAAIGKCDDCGKKVELSSFTNTCQCGADYNSFGQHLAPRSQWGEETGETASDILMSANFDSDF